MKPWPSTGANAGELQKTPKEIWAASNFWPHPSMPVDTHTSTKQMGDVSACGVIIRLAALLIPPFSYTRKAVKMNVFCCCTTFL